MSVPVRSLIVGGRRTSVRLDQEFWDAFCEIARIRSLTPSELATEIDGQRGQRGLSNGIRIYVMTFYQSLLAAALTMAGLYS